MRARCAHPPASACRWARCMCLGIPKCMLLLGDQLRHACMRQTCTNGTGRRIPLGGSHRYKCSNTRLVGFAAPGAGHRVVALACKEITNLQYKPRTKQQQKGLRERALCKCVAPLCTHLQPGRNCVGMLPHMVALFRAAYSWTQGGNAPAAGTAWAIFRQQAQHGPQHGPQLEAGWPCNSHLAQQAACLSEVDQSPSIMAALGRGKA